LARRTSRDETVATQVLDAPDTTIVDLLDRLLNKGVMLNGDLTLGVAGVDLIYLRLSALLCAADRVLPRASPARPRPHRGARRSLKPRA
jgi:hypothetical protein